MTTRELHVRVRGELAGVLRVDADGRMGFTYDAAWLALPHAFALSASLPLGDETFGEAAHRFFANLLPEGGLRESVCRAAGLSVDNDFGLLCVLGEDCAGALQVVDPTLSHARSGRYVPISQEQLAQWNEKHNALASLVAHGEARLSLAGAQDKLPVYVDDKGTVCLATGGAPSSHLIKFGSARFAHLPENEVVTTQLAHALGLPTVDVTLHHAGVSVMCLVRRYDRTRDGDVLQRLHQEDFCQALGLSSHTKYEAEGGPTFAQCTEVVRRRSVEPMVDAEHLLRWQIFNAIAGNCDGHAKNLSLLYGDGARLAPFYDLVCTRAYAELSPKLAMSVGDQRDPGVLRHKHWEKLASTIGVRPSYVIERVGEMSAMLREHGPEVITQLEETAGIKVGIAASLRKVWRKLARGT